MILAYFNADRLTKRITADQQFVMLIEAGKSSPVQHWVIPGSTRIGAVVFNIISKPPSTMVPAHYKYNAK